MEPTKELIRLMGRKTDIEKRMADLNQEIEDTKKQANEKIEQAKKEASDLNVEFLKLAGSIETLQGMIGDAGKTK